jgi:hypothetical protein
MEMNLSPPITDPYLCYLLSPWSLKSLFKGGFSTRVYMNGFRPYISIEIASYKLINEILVEVNNKLSMGDYIL